MVTVDDAIKALTNNLGNPSRDPRYQVVVHERVIAELVGQGVSEAEARDAALSALHELGGHLEIQNLRGFGTGSEPEEVWYIPESGD